MTDQSRVDAVLNAIRHHMNARGPIASDSLAQAAIEASDAWLAAQIAAQDPIAFRRTKSPRIEGLAPAARRILDR